MKYIITDKDEVRIGGMFHQDMGSECEGKVIRAGHCEKLSDGSYKVWGSSIGYGIDAQQEDAELLYQLINVKKEYKGCPCGMNGACCENPIIGGGEHDCDDTCESVCEDSFELVCSNCGASCYHEL